MAERVDTLKNSGFKIIQDKEKFCFGIDAMLLANFAQAHSKEEVFDLLKQTLRPEFLNRIDEIVLFQPLRKKEIGKIVQYQLRGFNEMLSKRNIIMTFTQDAVDYLMDKGYDPAFGARPLKRVIQQEVLNKLSKEILAGNVNDGDRITLDYFEETGLVFRPTEQ